MPWNRLHSRRTTALKAKSHVMSDSSGSLTHPVKIESLTKEFERLEIAFGDGLITKSSTHRSGPIEISLFLGISSPFSTITY